MVTHTGDETRTAIAALEKAQDSLTNINTDDELTEIENLVEAGIEVLATRGGGRQWDYRDIRNSRDVEEILYEMSDYYGWDYHFIKQEFWNQVGFDSNTHWDLYEELALFEVDMLAHHSYPEPTFGSDTVRKSP